MKGELLEVYDLKENFLEIMERQKFYKEIKEEFAKTGKITKQVKSVRILLMNSKGEIYLQKRSKHKKENPSLYDKTIGGHVSKGYTEDLTVIKECAEELGFAAAVLKEEEFEKSIKEIDLEIIGLFKKIERISGSESVRITQKGEKFIQPTIDSRYIGYYDGSIKFKDAESSGIEVWGLKDLKKEMKENPGKFTEDIKSMIKKYEKYVKPI